MYALFKRAFGLILLLTLLAVAQVHAAGFSASIGSLSWSPDGQSLLYTVRDKGVYVTNLDGQSEPIIETDKSGLSPQWSPDGLAILATLSVDNQAGLFLTALAGGAPQRLTEDVGWRPQYYAPNGIQGLYAPDGENIAFLSLREGDQYTSLYLMTAAGEDERRLTTLGTVIRHVWSPDGATIVFTAIPDGYNGPTDLFMIDRDGENLRRLTQSGDIDSGDVPVWSPEGRRLLFTVNTPDKTKRIESIDLDGNNPQVVLENAFEPLYSPDGERLVFSSWGEQWMDLSVMDADGDPSERTTIDLGGTRAYYSAAWSPDSSRLAFVVYTFDDRTGESIYIANADGSDPQLLLELPRK